MKFNIGVESIQAEVKGNILVIRSNEPLTVLSSAVLNGGLVKAHGIINVQVPEGTGEDKNDEHWNAEAFLEKQVQDLGLLKGEVVGLMTAAKMENAATAIKKLHKTSLALFVTAGTTVAVTAGEPAASNSQPLGTINIILLVDGNMTDGCMVEAHKTITEAKTVALRELDLRSQFSGDLASGTLTDTIAVACTKKGELISFAGTFTLIGELIAQCVRECVKEAIYKQQGFSADRPLTARLAERGLQTENLPALLKDDPLPVGSLTRHRLLKEVEQYLADEKIASLVLAALRFDEDLSKGLLPKSGEQTVDQAAFEGILLEAVRNFNAGKSRSTVNRLRLQLRNELTLGPFTTCILEAILKKAYSKAE